VVLSILVLAGSATAFYFSLQPKGDTSKIVVNGRDYTWEGLFQRFTPVRFTANGGTYSGVRLSDIINDTGLDDREGHRYKVTGADGYQKEFSWGDLLNGYLVREGKKTIFPGLTKSFWVRDVVWIEVV